MTEINLYKPGSLNITVPFPGDWNELDRFELETVSKYMLSSINDPAKIKAALFSAILQNRANKEAENCISDLYQHIDPEEAVLNGLPLIEFIFSENTRTVQPYPLISFRIPWKYFYKGPADHFDDLTCGEFEDAEIFFYQFRETPSHEALAHLASILWRPNRQPYVWVDKRSGKLKSYNADETFPRFKLMSPWQLYTIFLWYSGCRNLLPKLFPTAFEGGKEKEEPDFIAFTKCIHSGAGPKNGSRDQIRTMLLKEFFLDMELEAQKAKELKKEYER